jgi:hypothetical protein
MAVESPSSNFVVTIVCFLIIAPCFVALILQLMYTCHQRKRARRERQLLAVSTNPTSRMLILSEILKNDCRVSQYVVCVGGHVLFESLTLCSIHSLLWTTSYPHAFKLSWCCITTFISARD